MARATGGAPQFVDARRIHPWWMKGLNAVGGLMPRHARLSAAQLWERASKHPRLHSVRPTSAAREALEVLVDSINREARLFSTSCLLRIRPTERFRIGRASIPFRLAKVETRGQRRSIGCCDNSISSCRRFRRFIR